MGTNTVKESIHLQMETNMMVNGKLGSNMGLDN